MLLTESENVSSERMAVSGVSRAALKEEEEEEEGEVEDENEKRERRRQRRKLGGGREGKKNVKRRF